MSTSRFSLTPTYTQGTIQCVVNGSAIKVATIGGNFQEVLACSVIATQLTSRIDGRKIRTSSAIQALLGFNAMVVRCVQ